MVLINEELAFYGAYHSNYENQLIHIVCVPLLLWSAFVIVGLLVHRVVPFLAWLAYSGFYFYLDPVVGSMSTAFYFAVWILSDKLIEMQTVKRGAKAVPVLPRGAAMLIAILAQVVGWGAQVFIGHAIYEGRKPALLDSLTQAFSLAPLFVVYEFIWMLFPGFQQDLRFDVKHRIEAIHAGWASQRN